MTRVKKLVQVVFVALVLSVGGFTVASSNAPKAHAESLVPALAVLTPEVLTPEAHKPQVLTPEVLTPEVLTPQ